MFRFNSISKQVIFLFAFVGDHNTKKTTIKKERNKRQKRKNTRKKETVTSKNNRLAKKI